MKIKECLGTETAEMAEQKAKVILQAFLDKNRLAIKAMRSFHQLLHGGTNIGKDQFEELKKIIKEESGGQLISAMGIFCTIGDEHHVFEQDNGQFSQNESRGTIRVVKGFRFSVVLEDSHFECVDLDFGLSRIYFDKKSPQEQEKFIRRFAERRRTSFEFVGDPNTLPLGFTAFISDQGDGFRIEALTSYRDADPRFFRTSS